MNATRFVENQNPPIIEFRRQAGKITTIVRRGDPHNIRQREAGKLVNEQLETMRTAVEIAEPGKRIHTGYGTSHEVRGSASSFPKFYGQMHFRNKADFRQALDKPGEKQAKLIIKAVEDLRRGEGYGLPVDPTAPTRYRLATREIHDRQGVRFVRIRGRIVPIRRGPAKPITARDKPVVEEPWL